MLTAPRTNKKVSLLTLWVAIVAALVLVGVSLAVGGLVVMVATSLLALAFPAVPALPYWHESVAVAAALQLLSLLFTRGGTR
jgi:hypothetical protein